MIRSSKLDPNNASRGASDLSEMILSQSNVDFNDRITVNRMSSVLGSSIAHPPNDISMQMDDFNNSTIQQE